MVFEAALNRLRGTGLLYSFGKIKNVEIKIVWNHIYALYLGVLFGLVTMSTIIGFFVFIGYMIGESKGWGEWVGTLTRHEPWNEELLNEQYKDEEGKTFPYIHQIANFFIKEEKVDGTFEERLAQYKRYATLALTLRGIFWWGMTFLPLVMFGVISIIHFFVAIIFLGICFPIACYLGQRWLYTETHLKVINFSRGWENQEIIYGLFQGIAIWITIGVVL